MPEDNTVNSQIVDAVTGTVTLTTGQAPSQAFGMIDAVMLETLGMAMYNAVNRQQSSSMISSAAVTSACARILTMQPPPPPPAPPPRLPSVEPLPPPGTPSPAAISAAALAEGQTAIQVLQAQSTGSSQDASLAQKDLQALAAAATAATAVATPTSST